MTEDDYLRRFDSAALPVPGPIARLRFLVRRHPIAIAAFGGLFAGGGAALLVVLLSGIWRGETGAIFVVFASVGLAAFLTGTMPFFVTRDRAATGSDIAAALGAATARERHHLVRAIEERLASRFWPDPMTTIQLTLLFDEIRKKHGDRARRRRLQDRIIHRGQKRLMGDIAA